MVLPALAFSYGTGNATPNLPIVMMECLYASPTYDMSRVSFTANGRRRWRGMESSPVEHQTCYHSPTFTKSESRPSTPDVRKRTSTTQLAKTRNFPLTRRNMTRSSFSRSQIRQSGSLAKRHAVWKNVYWPIQNGATMLRSPIHSVVIAAPKRVSRPNQDIGYIRKYYTFELDPKQAAAAAGGRDDSARVRMGENEFEPMFLIKQVPVNPHLLEMCFNYSASSISSPQPSRSRITCYQTILLNKNDQHCW
ncbi:uncharacterized protein IAS62_004210 [Cryptococcus decagattii]|uniref:Uncharacterized protein n=1 Tax=Cryptococcus decagattii TaxID=1859122 RepID=A0ABZ2AWF3_9TREE